MLEWLEGKKTYIMIAITAIFNLGVTFGWWVEDNNVVVFINTLLGAFGFGFLRAGVTKSKA